MQNNEGEAAALQSQFDGGDKQALLDLIDYGSAAQIKDELIDKSPYLSNEVLIATMTESGLAPVDMKDVILENSFDPTALQPVPGVPDTANSAEVVANIEELSMPPLMQLEVEAAQTGRSMKQDLMADIGYYKTKRELELNRLMRVFLSDTSEAYVADTLIDLLQNETSLNRKIQMIEACQMKNDWINVQAQLNTVCNEPSLVNYCTFMNLLVGLVQNNQTIYDLKNNATAKQTVEAIASDSLMEGYLAARAILHHVFGTYYPPVIITEPPANRMIPDKKKNKIKAGLPVIKNYPNPFDESTIIEIQVAADFKNAILKITDATGREVKEIKLITGNNYVEIKPNELQQGIYFNSLFADGKLVANNKMVKLK